MQRTLELVASLLLELHCAVKRLTGARLVAGSVPSDRQDEPSVGTERVAVDCRLRLDACARVSPLQVQPSQCIVVGPHAWVEPCRCLVQLLHLPPDRALVLCLRLDLRLQECRKVSFLLSAQWCQAHCGTVTVLGRGEVPLELRPLGQGGVGSLQQNDKHGAPDDHD